MNKPPAFQFYADDFLAGVATMSNEEVGLYIRLLAIQWGAGGITEDDISRLGTAMEQPSLDYVKRKFEKSESGLLKNQRLESERAKQAEYRSNRSESGKLGAEKRWHSHSTAIAQPMAKHGSPSPSPIKHEIESGVAERPSLEEVKAYAAQIGLGPWKAEDWFNEMEACGWLDFNHRPVAKWQPMLVRVKTKWEADGRPTAPPSTKASSAANGAQRGPSPFGPPISAVKEYAREKDDGTGRAVANALHWFAFWEKRGWKKKDGRSVDWKVELSAHLANFVGRHGVQGG